MEKKKRTQADYKNIRVLKTTHEKMKKIVERLDVSWVGLIESIADMSDEEVDRFLKPIVKRYKEKRFEEKQKIGGVSKYMMAKRTKELIDGDPEEIKRFLDSKQKLI